MSRTLTSGRWHRLCLAWAIAGGLTAVTLAPRVGWAQADGDRGPASELYVQKRPPVPVAPVLSPELQKLLGETETARDEKRLAAIGLLREFLDGNPLGESKADGMFKLAELLWEEARRTYLVDMETFERQLELCREAPGGCGQPPREPRIQLGEAAGLYTQLLTEFPTFRRADLVLYLVGFATKEAEDEAGALAYFERVIKEHPRSPLFGDAWMMVGEHHFAQGRWEAARTAFSNILGDPNAPTYDLAMFKTAWCDWKLGDVDQAARRFKEVLDLAVEADESGSQAQRRRRASLRDEALEYLVVVFTEDRSISAKEVFEFLASIGGERYSRDVLRKVADSYVAQSEYERATDSFRFLIEMEPSSMKAADYQRQIVEGWLSALDAPRARTELERLVGDYGPASTWAKGQRNRDALRRSLATSEQLVRQTATNAHAEAQAREKASKCPIPSAIGDAKARGKACKHEPNVPPYEAAAALYQIYLSGFAEGEFAGAKATEVRFLRAEIMLFKLGQLEAAGDEYMRVGRMQPVGDRHKDALLKAMNAYETARPKDTVGRRQLVEVDKKFAEAVDLYATLFPADPELVGVIFRNGKLFYDYGEYDEAIKRFGVIVTKYPDHPDAGPAGDFILKGLAQAQDYENIETWARKLKGARAFAAADQQTRLDRLIVESIGKSGEKYAAAGDFEKAAGFYLRVPKEFPSHKLASGSMMNAGVMYEKAKQPERAAEVYQDLAEQFAKSDEATAEKAAMAAGAIYEKVAHFDRAAQAYEDVVKRFDKSPRVADALFLAGVLRQALGDHEAAIAHYQLYARTYKERKDAPDVAFNIGVVHEAAGRASEAEAAFIDYGKRFGKGGRRMIEADVRAARAAIKVGGLGRARKFLDAAEARYKKAKGSDRTDGKTWVAEARYLSGDLVFRDYEAVRLDVGPDKLEAALAKKSTLLAKARDRYFSVVEFNDLRWATASLYRVGQIYDGFAEALSNAPTPPGLTEADATAYREALDLYVVDIQEQAIAAFATGYQKAIEMQIYDQYTAKIREALGRLAADKFPPEREARAGVRIGDRPLEVEPMTEVER